MRSQPSSPGSPSSCTKLPRLAADTALVTLCLVSARGPSLPRPRHAAAASSTGTAAVSDFCSPGAAENE